MTRLRGNQVDSPSARRSLVGWASRPPSVRRTEAQGQARTRITLAALAILLLTPHVASAHLVSTGVGPFYDGVAHFFVSPMDLVVVIALGMLGGLAGQAAGRWVVRLLPLAWLIGAAIGIGTVQTNTGGWVGGATMLIAGLLVALNPARRAYVAPGIAALCGLVHGYLNGQSIDATNTPFTAAIGITASAAIVALLVSAFVHTRDTPWQKIAIRALGSWTAAIGLLTLAWHFRPAAT